MGKYSNYCGCYSIEVGVTLIGFLHLNAALYFWARASTFEPIYMWLDILVAAMYTVRATYFFIMLNLDGTQQSRIDYFEYNKYTAGGLLVCGVTTILLKWIEWSHPPTWTLVAWAIVGGLNYYHWFIIKDYAGITGSSFERIEMTEAGADDDDLDENRENQETAFVTVNKIE